MDVFRILSRSTTLNKSSQSLERRSEVPSAGGEAKAQNFADDNPPRYSTIENGLAAKTSLGKRKREAASSKKLCEGPTAADLFADLENGTPSASEPLKSIGNGGQSHSEVDISKESTAGIALDHWSQEQCRQALKVHKLKVTLLDAGQDMAGDRHVRKLRKKSKSEQGTGDSAGSNKSKVQLYPQPVTSFSQLRSRFGLSRRLAENLLAQGYDIPTEVQLGGLPLLLGPYDVLSTGKLRAGVAAGSEGDLANIVKEGVDLLTVAPTGSGKTLAFLIPLIDRLRKERGGTGHKMRRAKDREERWSGRMEEVDGPRALIVAPTKELASQIVNEARKASQKTGVRFALVRKGMQIIHDPSADEEDVPFPIGRTGGLEEHDQDDTQSNSGPRAEALVKADVLVSTPLTLVHAVTRADGKVDPIPSVRFLVLDEADVLLDPLFRAQTLELWNACVNPLLRVSLWSATMGSSIEELAKTTISDRWKRMPSSAFPRPRRPPLLRLVVSLKDSAVPHITHNLTYCATEPGKLMALRNLFHPSAAHSATSPVLRPPFLVFCQTIPRAIALHAELQYDISATAGGPSRIACLHADLSERTREDIMRRFREAELWVLITTDLLARGVDFRGLNGVVNFDVPGGAAAYVHRVGRTGRAGRVGGVAVTLYTNDDMGAVKSIANVIAASERLRRQKLVEANGNVDVGSEFTGVGVQKWLLDGLPRVSKKEKKDLKTKGVPARRMDREGRELAKVRISTKSGWERRRENNRKNRAAVLDGPSMPKRQSISGGHGKGDGGGGESDFEGFE